MIIFDFLSANWDWLLAIVVIVVGVILRLRSLWKGNVIEWLVAICADAESIYGGGTGYLKLIDPRRRGETLDKREFIQLGLALYGSESA